MTSFSLHVMPTASPHQRWGKKPFLVEKILQSRALWAGHINSRKMHSRYNSFMEWFCMSENKYWLSNKEDIFHLQGEKKCAPKTFKVCKNHAFINKSSVTFFCSLSGILIMLCTHINSIMSWRGKGEGVSWFCREPRDFRDIWWGCVSG